MSDRLAAPIDLSQQAPPPGATGALVLADGTVPWGHGLGAAGHSVGDALHPCLAGLCVFDGADDSTHGRFTADGGGFNGNCTVAHHAARKYRIAVSSGDGDRFTGDGALVDRG